jgi:asparagine synthase (glutamine-hydrolysing)
MRHRGPNDEGYHLDDGIAIGVRRLSIVDVDGGHQPMSNESGSVVAAQNGELYNHRAVRGELEAAGHRLRTTCDTEVLPHLYEHVGDAAPERVHGMFAFIVWDAARRRAVLARDRLGIKPLYYAEVGELLLFGSELKALLASGLVSTEIDFEALDLYLSLGFVPGPRTLLREVKKLPPGHRMIIEPPGVRIERYWRYPEPKPRPARDNAVWREEFLELLDDAVRTRLMSDVPLGAMLSGGLDSSVVVALMARHMDRPVETFSVGFAGAADNELSSARDVAAALGAEHHELELSLADPVDLDALIWSLDEPVADLGSVGFAALSALTAEHVTVALTGQGADELLAGYDRYRQIALIDRWAGAPIGLRRIAASVGRFSPERVRRGMATAAAADPVLAALAARSEWLETVRNRSAMGPLSSVSPSLLDGEIASLVSESGSRGVERALMLDAQLSLVDDMLHYFDRTSMAHSLEVRVPFLDHRLVEFCATIPTTLKVDKQSTKRILRMAARGLVPEFVIDRPKVGFLSSAVDEWFQRQVHGFVGELLLDPDARCTEFLERSEVARLVGSPTDHRRSKLLLTLLMLELWLSTYLPRATRPLPTERQASVGVT